MMDSRGIKMAIKVPQYTNDFMRADKLHEMVLRNPDKLSKAETDLFNKMVDSCQTATTYALYEQAIKEFVAVFEPKVIGMK